jgi:hypothetical protein
VNISNDVSIVNKSNRDIVDRRSYEQRLHIGQASAYK